MVKVGEHITLDIIGTTKDYSPSFFEKIVYKIAKKAKVAVYVPAPDILFLPVFKSLPVLQAPAEVTFGCL